MRELDGYERWMVRSNLERIERGDMNAETTVATLRANGYERVAAAVESASKNVEPIVRCGDGNIPV